MFRSINTPRLENPTTRQKSRERLSTGERKRLLRIAGKKCEITGEKETSRNKLEGHHAFPVAGGGRKSLDNLVVIVDYVHEKIHTEARKRCKNNPDLIWSEEVYRLTQDTVQLAKWGRVLDGEDPETVYKRELLIEHLQTQQAIFEQSLIES